MAITETDLKIYLSGAASDDGAQTDPNAALGNYKGSTEHVDGTLFDDISGDEAAAGRTEYRCVCLKNEHGSLSLLDPKIWIEVDTGNGEDDISFAVEVPTGSDTAGNAQTIVNETTAPTVGSGNVSAWSDATSKGTGLSVDQGSHDSNLDFGEIVFIWIRRVVSLGAAASSDNFTIKIEGDTEA